MEVSAAFGLFGREDALRAIDDALTSGGSVLAVGDPGSGKSSLLRAAGQLAKVRRRTVLSVAPTQFDQGLPFAGLAELVGQLPEGADSGLPVPQRRALAVALQRAEPGEHDSDALAVSLAVRGLLTQLTGSGPVTLILDDLQWLDQASAGSLGFALRGIRADPADRLSVLVATRPVPGAGADLIRCLNEPLQEFSLSPLPDWAIGQLLRKRLGPRWTQPASAGVAKASGGNPFLAMEIARAMDGDLLASHGSAAHGNDPVFPVPPSLADLLRERVTRLPQDAREVLLLLSAAGRLTVAQLQNIAGEDRLRRALEAAADADVAFTGARSVVAFTHPLLASAIYDAAAPADRRRAHRALADSLEDPVERARHRSKSIIAPDEAAAVELERAAEISQGRGAPQLAGKLLEGAALATPAEPDAAASLGRWLRAVDAYAGAGDAVAARAALEQAVPLAADRPQQAQVTMRQARLAGYAPEARVLAEQAFRLAAPGSEVRADMLVVLAEYHRMECHGTLARRLSRLAVTAATEVGRPDIEFEALMYLHQTELQFGLGQPRRSWDRLTRLIDVPAQGMPPWLIAFTHGFFASWDDETAEERVREGIKLTVDAGRYGDLCHLYIGLILVLIRKSRVGDAQAALDEADRLGAWTTSSHQEDMARILVREYAGDLDAARELTQRAIARSRASGLVYWLAGFLAQLGFIETSARNGHAALEALRELAGIVASTQMADLEQLLWGVDYADAALQAGAEPDVEAAIAVLRRQAAAGRPEAAIAADRCQALLTAAGGGADAAIGVLRAITGQPGSECPFEAARSGLALGQVYRRAGYKGLATETLNAVAAAFDELGIPRWAQRARDEAGRTGLHPTDGALTATERRVAELVGAGRSNQETAAELFMSVKTVEANLTRVYRKLSLRSRTELANRMNSRDGTS